MKKTLKLMLMLVLTSLSVLATTHPIRNTTHTLEIHSLAIEGACAATAVSPKTLLTATHCLPDLNNTYLTIDKAVDVTLVKALSDGDDHTFLLLDGIIFTDVAKIAFNKISIADTIYMYGNPQNMGKFYRVGVVSTFMADAKECPFGCVLLQLGVTSGDSGGGIFKNGVLVGVVSGSLWFSKDNTFVPTYAKRIVFTEEQIKEAINYGR